MEGFHWRLARRDHSEEAGDKRFLHRRGLQVWLIQFLKHLRLIFHLGSYVLVRVSRFRERAKLQRPIAPNQLIDPGVLAKINNIAVDDTVSVLQFIQKYGTHYINSYVTGNSLYQVKRMTHSDRRYTLTSSTFSIRFSFSTKEITSTLKKGWNRAVSCRCRKAIFIISSRLGSLNI